MSPQMLEMFLEMFGFKCADCSKLGRPEEALLPEWEMFPAEMVGEVFAEELIPCIDGLKRCKTCFLKWTIDEAEDAGNISHNLAQETRDKIAKAVEDENAVG